MRKITGMPVYENNGSSSKLTIDVVKEICVFLCMKNTQWSRIKKNLKQNVIFEAGECKPFELWEWLNENFKERIIKFEYKSLDDIRMKMNLVVYKW